MFENIWEDLQRLHTNTMTFYTGTEAFLDFIIGGVQSNDYIPYSHILFRSSFDKQVAFYYKTLILVLETKYYLLRHFKVFFPVCKGVT